MTLCNKTWDAIIIGGGIAGSSAAIKLARDGHSVLVLERRKQIADKLCGEFLSPEARGYLDELGVLGEILNLGATRIDHLSIAEPKGANLRTKLPSPALGISRRILDDTLLRMAVSSGAVVEMGASVNSVLGSIDSGFRVSCGDTVHIGRVVFGAYGKSSILDKNLNRKNHPSQFVAFKAHYRGVYAAGSIEIFAFNGGYVGFSPVESDLVNACFIADRQALKRADGNAEMLMQNAAKENKALAGRLGGLKRSSKLIGCSEISFDTKGCFENEICMIGDSAGMIAPLCGDGMSMAMQSAMIAASTGSRYLKGEISSSGFQNEYSAHWQKEYRLRLSVGRTLQHISRSPGLTSLAVRICGAVPKLTDFLVGATRGRLGHPEFASQTTDM